MKLARIAEVPRGACALAAILVDLAAAQTVAALSRAYVAQFTAPRRVARAGALGCALTMPASRGRPAGATIKWKHRVRVRHAVFEPNVVELNFDPTIARLTPILPECNKAVKKALSIPSDLRRAHAMYTAAHAAAVAPNTRTRLSAVRRRAPCPTNWQRPSTFCRCCRCPDHSQ